MSRTAYLLGWLLCVAIVAGCASGPPFRPDSPPADAALIYLYRPSSMVGAGNHYIAAVNGKAIARLKSGSYFPLEVAPGPVVIAQRAASALGGTKWGLGALIGALEGFVETDRFEARAGSRYFVQFPLGKLTEDEGEALKEMAGADLLPPLE